MFIHTNREEAIKLSKEHNRTPQLLMFHRAHIIVSSNEVEEARVETDYKTKRSTLKTNKTLSAVHICD